MGNIRNLTHWNTGTIRAHSRHMAMKRSGIKEKTQAQGIGNPMTPRLLPLKQAAEYIGLTLGAMRDGLNML